MSFNFMAAVIICSDFGAQENKLVKDSIKFKKISKGFNITMINYDCIISIENNYLEKC